MRFFHEILFLVLCLPAFFSPYLYSQGISAAEDADSLFFSAQRLQRTGDLGGAKQRVRSLLSRNPTYHDARVLYGRLLAWEGNYQMALVQFDSVLTVQPGHQEASLAKSQVLSWMRRYRQAAEILEILLRDSPTSAIYLVELGKVYFWGGAPRKALEYYERAYLQDPLSEEVMRGLARVHRQLRSYDLSLYWYRKLLARLPGDAEALLEVFRQAYRADHEVVLQWSTESFTKAGFRPHSIGSFDYYIALTEDWKPFLHASRVDKFSKLENRYGFGTYATFSYSASLLAQVVVSPGATVAPRADALADVSYGFRGGIEAAFGYRFLSFDSTRVHVFSPGISAYFAQDLWLSPRVYIGISPEKSPATSFTITLAYRPLPPTLLRLGLFTGNETFRATSFNEISLLKSSGGFIALKSRILRLLALEGMYQYTSRSISSNSHQYSFTVSFLF